MNGKFEWLFKEAIRVDGDEYRKLRTDIINLAPEEASGLQKYRADSDWHASLLAEILSGWREAAEHYQFIRRVAEGIDPSLEPKKYLAGKPTIEVAVEVLMKEEKIAPVLLEMIYKEWDIISKYAFSVCNRVLVARQEPQAAPVYRELLLNANVKPEFRSSCIRPLLDLQAPNLFDDLVKVYQNNSNHLELRVAALASLGTTKDRRAVLFSEKIFSDNTIDTRFRSAAATALGESGDVNVISKLVNGYQKAKDKQLRISIIFGLGALESRQTIQPFKKLLESEQDPGLRELINNKLLDLEE